MGDVSRVSEHMSGEVLNAVSCNAINWKLKQQMQSNWVPHKGEVHSSRAPRTFLEQWHIGPRYCQCCCLGKSHTSSAVSTTPAARHVTCWAVLKLAFSRVLSFSYLTPNLRVELTHLNIVFLPVTYSLSYQTELLSSCTETVWCYLVSCLKGCIWKKKNLLLKK